MANTYGMWDMLERGWGMAGSFLKQARVQGEFTNTLSRAGSRIAGIMMGEQNAGLGAMYHNAEGHYHAGMAYRNMHMPSVGPATPGFKKDLMSRAKTGVTSWWDGKSRSTPLGPGGNSMTSQYSSANTARAFARRTAAIGVGIGVGHHMLFNRHHRRDY